MLVVLIGILVLAPGTYDEALSLPAGGGLSAKLVLLATLSAFVGLLSVGVIRRWRWTFWLILVAFGFGVLRVPVAVLQLTGALGASTPTWYVVLQGADRCRPARHRPGHVRRIPAIRGLGRLSGRAGVWTT